MVRYRRGLCALCFDAMLVRASWDLVASNTTTIKTCAAHITNSLPFQVLRRETKALGTGASAAREAEARAWRKLAALEASWENPASVRIRGV